MLARLAAAVCLTRFAPAAWAAETKREVLYDIVGDFDHDGTPDRAALVVVGPGKTPASDDLDKERYWVQYSEQVVLDMYLGAGNAPLDISKPPSIEKANIADKDRNLIWVVPLEVNKAGALKVTTSEGWGSSHEEDETLTVQVKDGKAEIIGYDFVWELPGAESASCSIDLLKGNAIRDDNTKTKSKVKAGPIKLEDWKHPLWPKLCDDSQ